VARFNREATAPKAAPVERDADYYRAKLAERFLPPRDKRRYALCLTKAEELEAARAKARAAIAKAEGL
jgi:hypothetical protein